MARKRNNSQFHTIALLSLILFIFYLAYKFFTKKSKKKWSLEQIKIAKKHGLINDNKNNWTKQQHEQAQHLGLDTNEDWTPSQYETAKQAGLLSQSNNEWSPSQVKLAKKLELID